MTSIATLTLLAALLAFLFHQFTSNAGAIARAFRGDLK